MNFFFQPLIFSFTVLFDAEVKIQRLFFWPVFNRSDSWTIIKLTWNCLLLSSVYSCDRSVNCRQVFLFPLVCYLRVSSHFYFILARTGQKLPGVFAFLSYHDNSVMEWWAVGVMICSWIHSQTLLNCCPEGRISIPNKSFPYF